MHSEYKCAVFFKKYSRGTEIQTPRRERVSIKKEGSESIQEVEQSFIAVPVGQCTRRDVRVDTFQRFSLGFSVSPRVDVSCGNIGMAQDISNIHQVDAGLIQLGTSKNPIGCGIIEIKKRDKGCGDETDWDVR